MGRGKCRFITILALLAWMGIILFLSSRTSLPTDAPAIGWLGQYQDEVGHFGEYAVLGILTFVVLRPRLSGRRAFLYSLAFCVAFSLVDETFQGFVPNRTREVKDLVLDALGAVTAITATSLVRPWLRRYFSNGDALTMKGKSRTSEG